MENKVVGSTGSGKKIKILAYCDTPSCATGFGSVSRNILLGLQASGRYEITILGINYWGYPHPFKEFNIFPVGINNDKDPYGRQWVAEMMLKLDYDILFTLQDSFILDFMSKVIGGLRQKNPKLRWINYFPIDGVPKKAWIEAMDMADHTFTYTEWGKQECEKIHPPCVGRIGVIPHGVNVKDFFPVPKTESEEFRKGYFGPLADRFIVVNVNRNQQRKDLPRTMMAFKKFLDFHPNSLLYLHCAAMDHGWDLVEVARSIGLKVNENVAFPDSFNPNQGYPLNIVNRIYNAADVVVSTTLGEGWGLSQTEAMACCKPVISPDNTACSEIVGSGRGMLIRSGWDSNAFVVLPHDNEVLRPVAHVEDLTDALRKMCEDVKFRTTTAINGYKWVTSTLRWDKHVVPQWQKVFDSAADDIEKGLVPSSARSLSSVEV